MHRGLKYTPSAVIMNHGLHQDSESLTDLKSELSLLIHQTEETFRKYRTVYILHSPTFFNKSAPTYHSLISRLTVDYSNTAVVSALPQWNALNGRYLDMYNLSKQLHHVPGCPRTDGIHFNYWCNYQALGVQWDFNWLRYLGVITS